jgi:glycosyltransferase involved in cell wall biosynthesis
VPSSTRRGITADIIQIVCGAGIVSGKEIVSLLLGRGLRDAGWNPEFITSRWGNGQFILRLEQNGFKYHRLRLGFISASLRFDLLLMTLDQMRYWPGLAYGYARLIAARKPRAIIHTNWHHALLLLPFLRPHRDIFWMHELVPNVPHYVHIFRAIARRVGRFVCVSHAAARSLSALGVAKSQIAVIHNGIPPIKRTSWPGKQKPVRLGIIGQVGPWKGHDDLVEALALLVRGGTHVSLRIFGDGAPVYVESLKQRIAKLKLVDKVEWCGYVSKQADIFEAIDVCVVPSRCEEALGMAAIEASGFGRPVICSARGGLPEIVLNGDTGFVVEAQRPDQLAQAITSFARSPDLIRTMGEAARRRIQSEFSLDVCVNQFAQIIKEVTV